MFGSSAASQDCILWVWLPTVLLQCLSVSSVQRQPMRRERFEIGLYPLAPRLFLQEQLCASRRPQAAC